MDKRRIVLTIDADLDDALRALAAKERRSISDQACVILAAVLRKYDAENTENGHLAIADR